jgi:hypothetical protein
MSDLELTATELEHVLTLFENHVSKDQDLVKAKHKLMEKYKQVLAARSCEILEEIEEVSFIDFSMINTGTMVVRSSLLKKSSWAAYKCRDHLNGRGIIVGFKYYYNSKRYEESILDNSIYPSLTLPVVHWENSHEPRIMNPLFVESEKNDEFPKKVFKLTKRQKLFLSRLCG